MYAREQELEDKIFNRWLHHQEMNYEDFRSQVIPKKIQIESEDKILNQQKELINKFKRGGEMNGNI